MLSLLIHVAKFLIQQRLHQVTLSPAKREKAVPPCYSLLASFLDISIINVLSHSLRKVKIHILTVPNASSVVKQQKSSSLLVAMQNGTATSEESLVVFKRKLKTLLPHDLATTLFGICPK